MNYFIIFRYPITTIELYICPCGNNIVPSSLISSIIIFTNGWSFYSYNLIKSARIQSLILL